jgi:hypothetical protein
MQHKLEGYRVQEEARRNLALLPFAHFSMEKLTGSTYNLSIGLSRRVKNATRK